MDLKAALWACGHTATSSEGIQLLFTFATGGSSVFADTVKLAQNCPVYSIRGTAFYVLGLMGCTYKGANILYELGNNISMVLSCFIINNFSLSSFLY